MPRILPFDELDKSQAENRIIPFERLEKQTGNIVPFDQLGKKTLPQQETEEEPLYRKHPRYAGYRDRGDFIAKHPNLYGAFGVAQALVPYIKYLDPSERKRFAQLSTQKQTRELLLQNLETIGLLAAPAITKGAVPIVARYLPKLYKTLKFAKTPIKEWGKLKRTPAREVAAKAFGVPAPTPAPGPKTQVDIVQKPTYPAIQPRPTIEVPKVNEVELFARIQTGLRSAKLKRKEQELLYTKERKARIAKAKGAGEGLRGLARHRVELRALEGPMQQVEFKTLKDAVSQADVEDLFDLIYQKLPNFYHQKTAGRGMAKLFGEYGGNVPQESELKMLRKVFPEGVIRDLLATRPTWTKMKQLGYEAINVPRAIMASFDLSAPLRQGIFLAPRHPIRFAQSFVKMFRQFGSERAYRAVQASIEKKVSYNLMQEYGLALTDLGAGLTAREEAFMGAQLAEKIPLIGRVVRASARAHTGFLNKFRADVFDDFVKNAAKAGINIADDPKVGRALAGFINVGTGRGNLGALENAAVILNSAFFSPRLMSSRLHLLNPIYYARLPAPVRKEALKSLFAFTAMIGTTLGIAKAAGLEVGTNPYSADFLKIIVGKTRIDIMGGFQQYIRSAAQLIRKRYVSSTTGKEYTLGEGYKPITRAQILQRQAESKLSPPASFAWALLKQQDISTGKPISVPKEVGKRFVPMVMQDIYDLYEEDPSLVPIGALGIFGVGLQTYGPRRRKSKGIQGIKGF